MVGVIIVGTIKVGAMAVGMGRGAKLATGTVVIIQVGSDLTILELRPGIQ